MNNPSISFDNELSRVRQYPNWLITLFDRVVPILRKYYHRKENDKVIIIALYLLGDTVMSIPAIEALLKIYGNKKVYIYCFDYSKTVYELKLKDVEYITVKRNDFLFSNRIPNCNAIKLIYKLKASNVVDLTGTINSSILAFLVPAFFIIGLKGKSSFRLLEKIYDKLTPIRTNPHLIDMYLDVVKLIAREDFPREIYELQFPRQGSFILIHPFASRESKELPFGQFIDLAYELFQRGEKVIFLIPSDRSDQNGVQELKRKGFCYHITTEISELLTAIGNCYLFIGNDSGPMHVAALLGKPTFSIFGPVNPEFSKPLGKHHGYFLANLDCVPTKTHYCAMSAGMSCPHLNCLKQNSTLNIWEELRIFIRELDNKFPRTIHQSF